VAIDAGERQVVVTMEYGTECERVAYDLVVVAIGFQARWFERLLGGQARRRLEGALAGAELERQIEVDLPPLRRGARLLALERARRPVAATCWSNTQRKACDATRLEVDRGTGSAVGPISRPRRGQVLLAHGS